MSNPEGKYFPEHRRHIKFLPFTGLAHIQAGDMVQFNYDKKIRRVFVLNPKWHLKLHGLVIDHIPHKFLVPILSEVINPNPKQFYNEKLRKNPVHDFGSYRTFDVNKISGLRLLEYELPKE